MAEKEPKIWVGTTDPESAALKKQAADQAETEFRQEQEAIRIRQENDAKERKKLEAQRAKGPEKIYHLLVAKHPPSMPHLPPRFSVVGLYSDREKLANGLAGAVMPYAGIGVTLGVIDFDLSVKLDQPAVQP